MYLESDLDQKKITQIGDYVNILIDFLTYSEPILAKLWVILHHKLVLQLNTPQT